VSVRFTATESVRLGFGISLWQAGYGDLCVIREGEERLRQRLKSTVQPAAVEREVRQMVTCAVLSGLQQVALNSPHMQMCWLLEKPISVLCLQAG
jgi:hypothetical protein